MHVRTPSALTEEALKRIGELYAIEAEIRGMTAEQRLAERQLKMKPLLKSLESWLREKMKTLSRHSELAKTFAYALNQWPALTYYADDGWAEADNNIAENALRMVSLGRKKLPVLRFGSWRRAGSAAVQPDRDVQTERSGARKLPPLCP
ncbi:IS66 family element, transposase [Shigella boydii]|uniref:IS66 family element, transposase n=1 Tax=Shigella boydii TaxID=621 RepID=A0A2X2HJ21_SHIBO|nr:IS66 family element, transposase [Shigella boydii]